ncbi:response regulator [Streptosporangium sp. NPDC048047]|uniref:response regulator n=1 Tax=Streptosporangium sp. NPDC048047 TaxID=3155748 RepID=UPI0034364207
MVLRCLVVDDDDRFLTLAREILEGGGITVAGTARAGAEALRLFADLAPDVVLVDVHLGPERGIDVARLLADAGGGAGPGNRAVVILVSVYGEEDLAGLASAGPVTAFLPKADLSAQAVRAVVAARRDGGGAAAPLGGGAGAPPGIRAFREGLRGRGEP